MVIHHGSDWLPVFLVVLIVFFISLSADEVKTEKFDWVAERGSVSAEGIRCKWTEIKPGPKTREKLARGIRLHECTENGVTRPMDCGYFGGLPIDCNKSLSYREYLQDLAKEAMNRGRVCLNPEVRDKHCGQRYRCVHGPCKTKPEL